VERHTRIRSRAFELYLERGQETGHELDDWLRAEQEIDGRSADGSSIKTSLGEAPQKINIGALSLNI